MSDPMILFNIVFFSALFVINSFLIHIIGKDVKKLRKEIDELR